MEVMLSFGAAMVVTGTYSGKTEWDSSGDIWVYAYSGNGYNTHFYTLFPTTAIVIGCRLRFKRCRVMAADLNGSIAAHPTMPSDTCIISY
ncbi:MAG: hypothetical protein LBI79_05565 [Nitrososphaerota archaeon]|jgi:hypothetical protein|nr:hypothetical protein [Nitrososphaerota archaeon]